MPITRRHFMPLAAGAALAVLRTRLALAQQSLPLAGIASVTVRVRDLATAKTFYQSLGLEEVHAEPGTSLLRINERQVLRLIAPFKTYAPGFVSLGFETADLNALHEEYASHGLQPAEIVQGPEDEAAFLITTSLQIPTAPGQSHPLAIQYVQSGAGAGAPHLSTDCIGERLLAVSIPCMDPDDAREFYLNDLSFKPLPGSPMLLHLPGSSGQYIAIVSGFDQKARLILESASLSRAERRLHHEHIAFSRAAVNKDGGLEVFSFFDPDGNAILVQQR